MLNPVHDAVRPETKQVPFAGDAATVYEVIAVPPLGTGADQETDAEESPRTAEAEVGLPGATFGVTDADAEPGPLIARTGRTE